jgi:glycine cleavage system H protein
MSQFSVPSHLRYTAEHEWASLDGDLIVTVGITDFAQDALGDITFVELPAVGRVLKAHETFGTVESVKTYSDLYSPLAGEVVEVNQAPIDDPASINGNAYGQWLIRIRIADAAAFQALLDAAGYEAVIAAAG